MGRKKNPRRRVMEMLRQLGQLQKWALLTWDIHGTVPDGAGGWRKRTPEELPENQDAAWTELQKTADVLRNMADHLDLFVDARGDYELPTWFTSRRKDGRP